MSITGLAPWANVTSYPEVMEYANTVTDNFFGVSILVVIFVVVWAHGSRDDAGRAFGSASFVTMLFSFFFGVLNLVPGETVIVFIVLTALSAFAIKRND